ncbi:hypothetical protein SORBI_3002G251800 [Sorghum bicolor]|uniref:Large ribosomal subunit protein eL24-related N-terminal domain-containing protein n=1 Tax=Sorghum bicolor TaxID=4558 RepID=A0A1W0W5R7_SORBI|nr:hypothetical protein SORBI_3002G251800 [Sorghum bicolor]
MPGGGNPLAPFLVASLKRAARLRCGEQLHALAAKSGLLACNAFVRNSVLSFYSRLPSSLASALQLFDETPAPLRDTAARNSVLAALTRAGHLDRAQRLLDEMPRVHRDAVSYTTLVTALARAGHAGRAVAVFRGMLSENVVPNEVTLAGAIMAFARCGAPATVGMIHGFALKRALDGFVIVATNLVHAYAGVLELYSARAMFDGMTHRNAVTWNAMLNGYVKAEMIDMAAEVFWRIPERDEVSWLTLIDGYICADLISDAMKAYVQMVGEVGANDHEVLLVDLMKACARYSAITEGQQLHTVILKNGFDAHAFVQATLVHFYGCCGLIGLAQMAFKLSDKSHTASWNALLAALLRKGLIHEARELFDDMPERDTVSWSTMISGYVQTGRSDMALELFYSMLNTSVEPNEVTLASALSAIADSGTLDQEVLYCRTELCCFGGAKIYPCQMGARFTRADSQVFLVSKSKCKCYLHNCLKPAKLSWTAMYMKQHKIPYMDGAVEAPWFDGCSFIFFPMRQCLSLHLARRGTPFECGSSVLGGSSFCAIILLL